MTFEQWRQAFILECQKLGVTCYPAHWSLHEYWQRGDNPEIVATSAEYWQPIPIDRLT